ncbi:DUF1566 domain-containing protein [bacterium]|nr:DUF1566 domain-containing protein [bacterium]MBU1993128.1 DUF1566 domain-containing protein [bacterium]
MIKILTLSTFLLLSLFANENYRELDKQYSYLSAVSECKNLAKEWRLPEIWELFPLRGETELFGKDKRYWSITNLVEARETSTQTSSDESFIVDKEIPAFAFYLQDGDITPTPKFINAHTICTNLPKTAQNQQELQITDQGVIDAKNDILWEPLTQDNRHLKRPHEEAQEVCEYKTLYSRVWRLPTLNELYSIVNYNYIKPSVNQEIFSNMQKKYYWSDDTFNDNEAYVVGFSIGTVATSKTNNKSFFRCVSDL